MPLGNSPAMSRISPVDAESVEVQTELSLMPNNRPNRGTVENRIKELKEEVEALKAENLQLNQQNQVLTEQNLELSEQNQDWF